jgi:parvulin-like peptidyl-prolyl isomerase
MRSYTLKFAKRKPISRLRVLLLCAGFFLTGTLTANLFAQEQRPAAPASAGQEETPQRQIEVLAVVNNQEITRQQIANECLQRFGTEAIQDIVSKYLITKELEKLNIVISEKDVNDGIANEAKAYGLSAERWIEAISTERNLTLDQIKNDYIWRKLALRALASNQIEVTDAEIQEQLEFEFGPRVQVRQIVVDTQAEMDQLMAALKAAPEEFERLAKRYSVDANSASMGGLLPPIRRNSGLAEFEKIVFGLQPGQLSEPLHIAEKYVVIRCERLFPAEEIPAESRPEFEQRIATELQKKKMNEAAIDMFETMKKSATIQNVMNDPELKERYPGVAAIVNGSEIPIRYVAETCISRFGAQVLTTEINRLLLKEELKKNNLEITQQDLDEEIVRAAVSMGYVDSNRNPNVELWLNFITDNDPSKVEFYVADEVWPTVALKKLVEKGVTVTEEDMTRGFEANFGARVEVLAILTDNHQKATRVWKMAADNPTAEFFGQLANEYSIEPASRNNFGQVPPIQRHGGRPELEKEAFSLKPGEISKVVQVGGYWVIMYCQGMTEPVVTEYEAVKDEVYKNIMEKKLRIAMYDKFQQVTEDAQIDNYLAGTSQTGKAQVREARQSADPGQGKLRKP